MKLTVWIVIACLLLVEAGCSGYNKKLQFPSDVSLSNYLVLNPDFSGVQEAISICAWVKKYRDDSDRYWFSYATSATDKEIILSDRTSRTHLFADTLPGSDVIPLNEWTHMCLTWSAVSQVKQFYLDGAVVSSERTPSGRKIAPGGTLVLGQEQDTPGGRFELGQAFGGEIYELNVLKRALSGAEIGRVFRAGLCFEMKRSYSGDLVLGWEDVLKGTMHGDVKPVAGECDKWDALNDFIGQEITATLIDHLKIYHRD